MLCNPEQSSRRPRNQSTRSTVSASIARVAAFVRVMMLTIKVDVAEQFKVKEDCERDQSQSMKMQILQQ